MPFTSSPPPHLYPLPRDGGEGRVRGGRKVRGQRRAPMKTGELFIGGNWRPPVSGETYATINPATEEESARVAKGDERDVDLAVAAARKGRGQPPPPHPPRGGGGGRGGRGGRRRRRGPGRRRRPQGLRLGSLA